MITRAGVARRSITPPPGTNLIGYGNRFVPNIGAREPLTATVLVIQSGTSGIAIVSCDLLAVSDHTVALVQSQLDIPVILCCTHTHAGPVSHASGLQQQRHLIYVRWMVNQIVMAVHEAEAKLSPATLLYGHTEAHIAVNRRQRNTDGTISIGVNPDGPIDREVTVVDVHGSNGRIATLVNFACHPTSLGPANLQASADWVGIMRAHVENQTGTPCLFIQGACADLNPRNEHVVEQQWQDRFALGFEVGQAVVNTLDQLKPLESGDIVHWPTYVDLPIEPYTGSEAPEYAYRYIIGGFANVPPRLVDPLLNYLFPWSVTLTSSPSVRMRTDVVRLGELVFIGLGAEVFTEIGMALKDRASSCATLIGGVTNGCISYLATPDEHALGGYEVDVAPYFFRVPGRLSPHCADIVIDAVGSVIDRL